MSIDKPPKWDEFIEKTQNQKPRVALLEALKYVPRPGKALDVGAGAFNESQYLLKHGFEVTAIDSEPAALAQAKTISDKTFHFYPASYEQFNFPEQEFDLVIAMYSLPFTSPEHFDDVIGRTLGSLRIGGVFTGHFFGENDEWNNGQSKINFVNGYDLRRLFGDFEILDMQEREGEEPTDTGGSKYWHIYQVIAIRRQ